MSQEIKRPPATGGMRHIALFVEQFDAALIFYTQLLGMTVEWRPDDNNVYLTSGNDNLALHRFSGADRPPAVQRLDHIGFIIDKIDDVDQWHEFLKSHDVPVKAEPKTHRDGARSFYCLDPDGTLVQLIYHPPISIG